MKIKLLASTLAAIVVAAAAFIEPFEGRRLETYRDPVGIPTACVGDTGPDVVMGRTFTNAECTARLERRITREFLPAVQRCVRVSITPDQIVALISFAYNVGAEAMCRSTLVRKLNAGDCLGAAAEFDRWTRAGGTTLPGLARRRNAEESLFLGGCNVDA